MPPDQSPSRPSAAPSPDGPAEPVGPEQVALFVTCVGDIVEPDVPAAVVRFLRTRGFTVTVPRGQTCCGQPAWNSGFVAEAAAVATPSLEALEAAGDRPVVVPAGSCATMMRLYWPEMFERAGDPDTASRARALAPRIREFTEFVAALPETSPSGSPADRRPVAYHHSCHMTRELGLVDEPLAVLRQAGCEPADWPDGDRCCGFGGTFSVKLPETSVAMADEKLASIPQGVDQIVGADPSCLLHLAARARHEGIPVTVRHIAEIMAPAPDDGGPADG